MNRIKKLRLERGLTLKQLSSQLNAVGLNTTFTSLSRYERGDRYPKFVTWQKLADYFGVSVPYLQGQYDHLTKKEAVSIIREIMSAQGITKRDIKDTLKKESQ
ncbi:helix-turn-helix transcriptional regulator [Lactobacillus crispatus]|uniref:helix-turn-helix domain-containing protein n=1 Tax=Lactobacillus crispatus TaxID=47770 RepID=UPI003F20D56B